MISFFDDLIKQWNLDLIIFAIVMLSGFFQERFLSGWKVSKDSRLSAALKTLIVSFLASSIYIFFSHRQLKGHGDGADVLIPWGKYFMTFFAATSVYDLLVRPFRRWLAKVTGEKDEEKTDGIPPPSGAGTILKP